MCQVVADNWEEHGCEIILLAGVQVKRICSSLQVLCQISAWGCRYAYIMGYPWSTVRSVHVGLLIMMSHSVWGCMTII